MYASCVHFRMKLTFVELPSFQAHREDYLSDQEYRHLQSDLLGNPDAGDVMRGCGGLRKIRFADKNRGKGKRGGLRVIYFYWKEGSQIWLFVIYDKDEMDDLTVIQRKTFSAVLRREVEARCKNETKPI